MYYNAQKGRNNGQPPARPATRPERVPEDYVDRADELMSRTSRNITTSKLRNLLSLVTDIYNTESRRTEPELLAESRAKLMQMRVRVAYEAGREKSVADFVDEAHLLQYIKGVTKREDLIRLARYMEALVAYHRYYGGRE